MKKKWKYILGTCLLLLVISLFAFRAAVLIDPPEVEDKSALSWERKTVAPNHFTVGKNWLRKNEHGWWEMYLEGKPYERGVAMGKLVYELNIEQEKAFVTRLRSMAPGNGYQRMLKYGIAWFNRNLDEYISEEYLLEIYGSTSGQSGPDPYEYIGPKYQRKLNYHASHDIGHALQNMNLVACTSFGAWDEATENGELLVGRNFDFYVGDDFAKNKMVAFVRPEKGHAFMMVTWPGMMGVVSGMNERGLTLTLNSAKSGIPSGAKTPVSIVGREILQYAENIQEAYDIAEQFETFVTETFHVGSAIDGRSYIIEKTPEQTVLYEGDINKKETQIICTNHLQSKELYNSALNMENIAEKPSLYRFLRTEELLRQNKPLTPESIAGILRNQRGIANSDIGMGNEKAVNQLIAHHSIIFQPEQLKVWVSAPPFQLGEYFAYDLDHVFSSTNLPLSDSLIQLTEELIPVDSFQYSGDYEKFVGFVQREREIKRMISEDENESLSPEEIDAFRTMNPNNYLTYQRLGEYFQWKGDKQAAIEAFREGLTKEISTKTDQDFMEQQIRLLGS